MSRDGSSRGVKDERVHKELSRWVTEDEETNRKVLTDDGSSLGLQSAFSDVHGNQQPQPSEGGKGEAPDTC
jgi:hypothetical protein